MKLNKPQVVFVTVGGTLSRGIKVYRKGLDVSEYLWVNV